MGTFCLYYLLSGVYSDILRHFRLMTVAHPASQFLCPNVTQFFLLLDLHKVRPSWCVHQANLPSCPTTGGSNMLVWWNRRRRVLLQMPLDIAEGISQDLSLSLFWWWVYPVYIVCHRECDHRSILHQCRLTTLSHPSSQCRCQFFWCHTIFLMSHHFFFSVTIFHIEFHVFCKNLLIGWNRRI